VTYNCFIWFTIKLLLLYTQ